MRDKTVVNPYNDTYRTKTPVIDAGLDFQHAFDVLAECCANMKHPLGKTGSFTIQDHIKVLFNEKMKSYESSN